MNNYKIILVLILIASAVLLRRWHGVNYRTMGLDLLCYCSGAVLVQTMVLAVFGMYWTRDWEQDGRQAYLGWVGEFPWPLWMVVGVVGVVLFVGRLAVTQKGGSPS